MSGDPLHEHPKDDAVVDAMSSVCERLRRATDKLQNLRESNASRKKGHVDVERPATKDRVAPARLPANTWTGHLHSMVDELGSVARGTEGEFLSIGSKLQDFYHRAKKISEMSEAVARMISDAEVEDSIAGLNRILGRMKGVLAGLGPGIEQSNKSAKVGAIVEKTAQSLESLKKKHDLSASALKDISKQSRGISVAMGEVVKSLQFQDITRQEMERVKAALGSLRVHLRSEGGPDLGSAAPSLSQARLIAEAGDVCEEQVSRLVHVRDELDDAVHAIGENLRGIAWNAAKIAEEARAISGGSEGGYSFLSGVKNSISAVTDALSAFSDDAEACRELSTAMDIVIGAAEEHGGDRKDGYSLSGFKGMTAEMNTILNRLHRMNGNVLYRLSLIEESGCTLSDDIEAAVREMALHVKVRAVVDEVSAGLNGVVAESRRIAPSAARHRAPPTGDALNVRDTGKPHPAKEAGPGPGEDLGDNVELF